ncbi:putative bifunctional diguanylate cyclase/phosphodiesterase [Falsihalocynthiibacter arcticus]|uniref:putative bifunctional diguanylate cyclase/phosphodiesterase n=1 Tax=Falsihalocynthiibacter arcticus TaxID=1579316 RepID=UPI001F2BA039|nr:GGDEF and EAL domain-containing protein [Falsihalocynthiibacter arcticus]
MPKEGWKTIPPALWLLRSAFLVAALMIIAPMLASAFLIHQRHEYIDVLSEQKGDLHRQSRRLHLAMEAAGAGVWEFDVDKKTIIWDARMNELYGYPPSFREHYHTDWAARIHPEDRERAEADFEAGVGGRVHFRSVYRILLPNGGIRHVRSLANIIQFKGRTKIVGVNWDVTEETEMQKSLEAANQNLKEKNFEIELARQRVEFLAHHDALTELPNRRFLDQRLEEHKVSYAAGEAFAGVLQIDLDGFKTVNDTLGHLAGDNILNQVGNILRTLIDDQDHVIRLGGDEFIIFISRKSKSFFAQENHLQTLAEKIIRRLSLPLSVSNGKITIGASIGIATDAISTTTPQNILRDADVALYEAKILGRGQFQLCDTELRRTLDRKNSFLSEIEIALTEGQMIPYYQPQYSGSDLSFFGVEALARWNHPTRGLLTPKDFLENAKEIGRDADIDRAILLCVLADRISWQKAGAIVPRISVNVSARQIASPHILDDLAKLDIPRGSICFELVESIFMDDENQMLKDNVAGIKDMGIEIEIDDFGTGFASIVALQKLRPMRLKIDNQLVTPISFSPSARKIVASLIEIGRSLDIEVIAEGIETQFHIDTLQSMGCHALQGYALCRPMSGDSFFELLVRDQIHVGKVTTS